VTLPVPLVGCHLGPASDVTFPDPLTLRLGSGPGRHRGGTPSGLTLSLRPAQPAPDQRLWPSTPSGVKGRYGAPPRCPLAVQLVTALTRAAAPLPRSAAGRPLTPLAVPAKTRPSEQGRALLRCGAGPWCGFRPDTGDWGVMATTSGPDHNRWLPGGVKCRAGCLVSPRTRTLVQITIVRRAITATGRASSPHRSHLRNYLSAPRNGDHQHPHPCTMWCHCRIFDWMRIRWRVPLYRVTRRFVGEVTSRVT